MVNKTTACNSCGTQVRPAKGYLGGAVKCRECIKEQKEASRE